MTTGSGTDGRLRPVAETDAKILDAVREIIGSRGLDDVTIHRVSEVSGVARTTLYRRYTDRYDLLQSVAEQMIPTVDPEEHITFDGFVHLLG